MNPSDMNQEMEKSQEELDKEEIELVLRKFAEEDRNKPLLKLLNSLFPATSSEMVKNEMTNMGEGD